MAKRKPTRRRQPISAADACLYEAQAETDPGRRRFMFALAYSLDRTDAVDMRNLTEILITIMGRAYLEYVQQ